MRGSRNWLISHDFLIVHLALIVLGDAHRGEEVGLKLVKKSFSFQKNPNMELFESLDIIFQKNPNMELFESLDIIFQTWNYLNH